MRALIDSNGDVKVWGADWSVPSAEGCTIVIIDEGFDPTGLRYNGTTWVPSYTAIKKELAEVRYNKEIGGTTFNGWPVYTDRESQSKIVGALVAVGSGLAPALNWKFADGVIRLLSAADVQQLAVTVLTHVQHCFNIESQKLAEIDSTGTTDIYAGW